MTSRLTFESDNGITWPLDGSDGITVVDLADGLFTVPADLIIDQRVSGDGGTLVNQRVSPRRLTLTFMVLQSDTLDAMAKWGALSSGLAAGGKLIFNGSNGTRQLRKVTLESTLRAGWSLDDDPLMAVSLIALDPWWYGPWESATGPFGSPTAFDASVAFDASLPFNGGSSIPITVMGDRAVWPMILVSGALTLLTINVGDSVLSLAAPLPSATWLAVETYPGRRGPHYGAAGLVPGVDDSPVNWGLLTEDSRLAELPLGSAEITYGATGTDGSSSWTVYWESRWLTP